jgi:hypothetical protein
MKLSGVPQAGMHLRRTRVTDTRTALNQSSNLAYSRLPLCVEIAPYGQGRNGHQSDVGRGRRGLHYAIFYRQHGSTRSISNENIREWALKPWKDVEIISAKGLWSPRKRRTNDLVQVLTIGWMVALLNFFQAAQRQQDGPGSP